jgi:integrase
MRVRKHLTAKSVAALKPPKRGKRRVADSETRGFVLEVTAAGRKTFAIRYGRRGRRRFLTLGDFGQLTVEDAREKAGVLLGRVKDGHDPAAELEAARTTPTVDRWFAEYVAAVEQRKKRPGDDRRNLAWTGERWKGRDLDSITPREVEAALHYRAEKRTVPARHRKGKAPGHVAKGKRKPSPATMECGGRIAANRWLASVKAAFEAACRAGILRENPARRVRKFPENAPRQRVLDEKELARLTVAIRSVSDPFVRGIFRLLVETGCRRSEALNMRWDDVDLESGLWTLRSTKAGRVQHFPLAAVTTAWLRGLPRMAGSPWVFPSPRDPEKPWCEIRSAWLELKTTAKLQGVNIHDLRRSFGLEVARKAGILAASKLLRHSSIDITSRVYAPLAAEELRSVAAGVLADREGKVLPMKPRRRAGGRRG